MHLCSCYGHSQNSKVFEILSGLEYLHEQHIVHADLRSVSCFVVPSSTRSCLDPLVFQPNILIDENLHIQIGDFGLARLRDPFSPLSTGSSSHTHVRWLAPELVAAQSPVSFQSDIYAFGCLWVEVGDVQCVSAHLINSASRYAHFAPLCGT